jgi:hypothetical protein
MVAGLAGQIGVVLNGTIGADSGIEEEVSIAR